MKNLKKIMISAISAVTLFVGMENVHAQKLDSQMEAAARCSLLKPLPPELAAFRLLQSSKVVTHETFGTLVVYLGALMPQAKVNLFNMTPTRWAVVNRAGQPDALIGALYSADAPIDDGSIVAAYQGGLKRRIDLTPISGYGLSAAQVAQAFISKDTVRYDNHLLVARLRSGDRLVICAPKDQIRRFTQ